MFCKKYDITSEAFLKSSQDMEAEKLDGEFILDITRICSIEKFKEIISFNGALAIIPDSSKENILAGLKYDNNGNPIEALIEIKVNKVGQSHLSVYSEDQTFREVIAKDLIDLIAQI